jgi:hypothetical protein
MNKIVRYVRRNLEEDNNSGFCMQIKEQRAGQISAAANAKVLLWMHFLDVWYSSRNALHGSESGSTGTLHAGFHFTIGKTGAISS